MRSTPTCVEYAGIAGQEGASTIPSAAIGKVEQERITPAVAPSGGHSLCFCNKKAASDINLLPENVNAGSEEVIMLIYGLFLVISAVKPGRHLIPIFFGAGSAVPERMDLRRMPLPNARTSWDATTAEYCASRQQ
ncbi:hypothetical protein MKZ38_009947 [Zalerion maritima]|uniref:Uncharacterized protein n=1 Tax=Zalerion maritima TaxID=339359 RepID=A0AAD5RG91_9PEZI|nr:hypothetical protein MKZ38_009947 [Zalerion maritima]